MAEGDAVVAEEVHGEFLFILKMIKGIQCPVALIQCPPGKSSVQVSEPSVHWSDLSVHGPALVALAHPAPDLHGALGPVPGLAQVSGTPGNDLGDGCARIFTGNTFETVAPSKLDSPLLGDHFAYRGALVADSDQFGEKAINSAPK